MKCVLFATLCGAPTRFQDKTPKFCSNRPGGSFLHNHEERSFSEVKNLRGFLQVTSETIQFPATIFGRAVETPYGTLYLSSLSTSSYHGGPNLLTRTQTSGDHVMRAAFTLVLCAHHSPKVNEKIPSHMFACNFCLEPWRVLVREDFKIFCLLIL